MHVALVFIPTAGVANQAATTVLARTTGVALVIGVLASAVSHALFPDAPGPAKVAAAPAGASPEAAGWIALQATLIVMPVFMLALSNPAFYLQGVMKTVGMGQQAGATTARTAGRELVGSTLVGAVLAMVVWGGLTLRPNLWMFALMDRGRIALDRRQDVPGQGHTFPSVVLAQRPDDDVLRAGARHHGFRQRRRCLHALVPCASPCLSWSRSTHRQW